MKKIIYTLLIILAANWLLASLFLQLDITAYSKSYFIIYSLQKGLILGACVFLVLSSKQRPDMFANAIWAVPLALMLLALAYYQVDAQAGEQQKYIPVGLNLSFLLSCLLVGFFEELLFRVYVFCGLWSHFKTRNKNKKKALIKTILITSFLFGIAHATNMFRTGFSIEGVVNQMLFAVVIGVFFQALFIRFNNIILIGVLHGIVNYLGGYKRSLMGYNPEPEPFVLNEFLLGIGILLAIFIVIVIPVSLWLIRPKTS